MELQSGTSQTFPMVLSFPRGLPPTIARADASDPQLRVTHWLFAYALGGPNFSSQKPIAVSTFELVAFRQASRVAPQPMILHATSTDGIVRASATVSGPVYHLESDAGMFHLSLHLNIRTTIISIHAHWYQVLIFRENADDVAFATSRELLGPRIAVDSAVLTGAIAIPFPDAAAQPDSETGGWVSVSHEVEVEIVHSPRSPLDRLVTSVTIPVRLQLPTTATTRQRALADPQGARSSPSPLPVAAIADDTSSLHSSSSRRSIFHGGAIPKVAAGSLMTESSVYPRRDLSRTATDASRGETFPAEQDPCSVSSVTQRHQELPSPSVVYPRPDLSRTATRASRGETFLAEQDPCSVSSVTQRQSEPPSPSVSRTSTAASRANSCESYHIDPTSHLEPDRPVPPPPTRPPPTRQTLPLVSNISTSDSPPPLYTNDPSAPSDPASDRKDHYEHKEIIYQDTLRVHRDSCDVTKADAFELYDDKPFPRKHSAPHKPPEPTLLHLPIPLPPNQAVLDDLLRKGAVTGTQYLAMREKLTAVAALDGLLAGRQLSGPEYLARRQAISESW
ncbi:hypothetical protein HKX48_003560 [Thoreauomyces humboldtii]|nr:hypothetical protein HKX48_003560 [Thoreauomyces humboldtii]